MKVCWNRHVKISIGFFVDGIVLIFLGRELTCNNHSRLEPYLGRDWPMLNVTTEINTIFFLMNSLNPLFIIDRRLETTLKIDGKVVKLHFIITQIDTAIGQTVIARSVNKYSDAFGWSIRIKEQRQSNFFPRFCLSTHWILLFPHSADSKKQID